MKRPPQTEIAVRSASTRHPVSPDRKPAAPCNAPGAGVSPAVAKYRSRVKSVIPKAPKGTNFAVISPFSSLLQSSDPTPMPMEKVARNRVTTCSFAPITFLARPGNWARKVAPSSQNHEIPKMVRRISRRAVAARTMFQVSATRLGFIRKSGAGGSARGMKRLDSQPQAARTRIEAETAHIPCSVRTMTPPRMVPIRIARKVPASMNALPPISSSSAR